jgi:hypothetical protein
VEPLTGKSFLKVAQASQVSQVARPGSEPGIFWFRLFSHSITLPMGHSGSSTYVGKPFIFKQKIQTNFFLKL